MLYKVEIGKNVFELNPELKAIPEFERLTDRQMTYVILATDYKTPYRKLSPEERKYHAALKAGYKLEMDGKRLDNNARNLVQGKVGNVQAAIAEYNVQQKDEDFEAIKSIKVLINQIVEFNNTPNKSPQDLKLAVELNVGKLDKLMETKKKLEEILEMREEPVSETLITGEVDDDATIDESTLPILAKVNQGIL